MDRHTRSGASAARRRFALLQRQTLSATLPLMIGLLAPPSLRGQTTPATPTTVIRAGKLFEPESGRLLEHPVIIVSGNRIESVGSGGAPVPSDARVVDLGNATILPGFIDVHTHLTTDAGGGGYQS